MDTLVHECMSSAADASSILDALLLGAGLVLGYLLA
jgi:hypothetical protein